MNKQRVQAIQAIGWIGLCTQYGSLWFFFQDQMGVATIILTIGTIVTGSVMIIISSLLTTTEYYQLTNQTEMSITQTQEETSVVQTQIGGNGNIQTIVGMENDNE